MVFYKDVYRSEKVLVIDQDHEIKQGYSIAIYNGDFSGRLVSALVTEVDGALVSFEPYRKDGLDRLFDEKLVVGFSDYMKSMNMFTSNVLGIEIGQEFNFYELENQFSIYRDDPENYNADIGRLKVIRL